MVLQTALLTSYPANDAAEKQAVGWEELNTWYEEEACMYRHVVFDSGRNAADVFARHGG